MEKQALKHRIAVAAGRAPADLRIANSRVIDVYNRTAFPADVLIAGAYIAGFGAPGFPAARQTFDAKGAYLAPGLIDAHVHIESSHLSPAEFSRLVVPCGTTTVIADPHEICNVCGLDGFDYMLSASEDTPCRCFCRCRPACPARPSSMPGRCWTRRRSPGASVRTGCWAWAS